MRSTSILLSCGVAMSVSITGTQAVPIAGIIDGIIPSAFRPTTYSQKNTKQTGVTLESLRILPDDDNDGLVDVAGTLKALEDGEILDLNGHVKIAGLVDTCIDITVDGLPTRKCGKKSGSRKHRIHGNLRDDWSKGEHKRCSNHFRAWHRHHDTNNCHDEVEGLKRRIAELERELDSCRSPDDFRSNDYSVKAVKHHGHASDNGSDYQPDRSNDSNDQEDQTHQWTWTDDEGKTWRNEAHGCKNGVYTYVDKDDVHVKACLQATVDVLGLATATADVQATASINLAEGKVAATATAKVGVEAGPAKLESETKVKANADLKKGEADVKVDSHDVLKLGNQKLVDSRVKAEVGLNHKACKEGATLNLAGICIKAGLEKDNSKQQATDRTNGLLSSPQTGNLLGNTLRGSRIL